MDVLSQQQAATEFWMTVRRHLEGQNLSGPEIDRGVDEYQRPLIEKGAEEWIYHREPEAVARDIAEILRD